jgi:acylphosphatase
MEDYVKAEFIVTGYVQGVGFRYFVHQNAKRLNIKGYVENLMNGNVQVIAQGTKKAVDELHKILQQGPSKSYVQSVEFTYLDNNHEFDDFAIR